MKQGQRRNVLAFALVLTFSLVGWTHWREGSQSEVADIVQPVAHSPEEYPTPAPEGVPPPSQGVNWSVMTTRNEPTDPVSDIDPFRAKSWYIPPPPQPDLPPPKPTAPPLRFKYMGKREAADGSGAVTIYLSKDNDFYTIQPGDVFDTHYRFENLENGQLVLTYLPLNTTQRLPTGNME